MDEKIQRSVADSTTEDIDFPKCPDCGEPFIPGHLCHESLIAGIETSMKAFPIALKTILMIKEATVYWKKGVEEDLLKAIAATVRKADKEISEIIEGTKFFREKAMDEEECSPNSV
jgi:ribosomal protein L32